MAAQKCAQIVRQIAREIVVEQADRPHLFAVDLAHSRKGEGLKGCIRRMLLDITATGASGGKQRVDFLLG